MAVSNRNKFLPNLTAIFPEESTGRAVTLNKPVAG